MRAPNRSAKDREGMEEQIKVCTAHASRHSKALCMANICHCELHRKMATTAVRNLQKKEEELAPQTERFADIEM
jgi:hypothetical protein